MPNSVGRKAAEVRRAKSIQSVNPGAMVGQCVPDVAANADWNASPYLLVVDGGAQPNGGTSAASPLWAALITLVNAARGAGKRIGCLTPLLYQSQGGETTAIGQAGCGDIQSGDNITATVGAIVLLPGTTLCRAGALPMARSCYRPYPRKDLSIRESRPSLHLPGPGRRGLNAL